MFEWTINVGTVLTVLTIVFTGASLYWKNEYSNLRFTSDIVELKTDIKQLNKVIMDLALQTQRLDILEQSMYELRHGKGWIKDDDKRLDQKS